jgi:3-hydroxypropanoate dehydrogenase
MADALGADALDQLFESARTQYDWEEGPLDEALLHRLYDLTKMGPTSANASPARFIFCVSKDAREKLASLSSEGNAPKIRMAPATVIIGMDLDFHDHLPELFPHADARSWFVGNEALARETAFRNSSLQGAWLIMAARALGLDAGPMSGFDKAAVDAAFWAGTRVETNFICSIGHGTDEGLHPRLPRLPFDEAASIL